MIAAMWAFRIFSVLLTLWGLSEGRTAIEDGITYNAAVKAAAESGAVCSALPPVSQWVRFALFALSAAGSWVASSLLGPKKPDGSGGSGGNAVPAVINDLLKRLIEGGIALPLPVDPPRPDQVTPSPTITPSVTPAEVIKAVSGPVRTELQLIDRMLTTHGLPSRLTLQADVAGQQVSLSLTSHPLVKPANPNSLP
jgi:hypothetical protein